MIRLRRRAQVAIPEAIRTERLELTTITPELLAAEGQGPAVLGEALGATVLPDWPPEHWEPHVHAHILAQIATQPAALGWHRYMLLAERRPGRLVGCLGAFPCAPGDVEIGYSVVPSFQRQGLGTEAANAFVQWLLRQPTVHTVSAQTFASTSESVKVMERCGMRFIGAGDEAGTVRYRRWR